MAKTREGILVERRRLKEEYGELFDAVRYLLFHHDPVGINFEVNADEYEPEVGTILPRLHNCQSEDDVVRVVQEEFIRWFGADTAGPRESYEEIASEIWKLWQRHRPTPKAPRALLT